MRPDPRRDGLTPRPGVADLRPWDRILLRRYRPVYHPVHTQCTWCALGPCDLDAGRRGACGQTLEVLAAREALMLAVSGACAHAAHARDVVERIRERFGPDLRLDLGSWVHIRTPIIELVVGRRPRRLRDLLDVLDYVETQLVKLSAATHFGGESDPDDLESKTFHAGTMDLVALEVADVAQIAAYRFPSGEPETPLVPLGLGQVDASKPVILCVGHHSAVGQRIGELLREQGLEDRIELVGLCCTAHDMARAPEATVKIVGNQRDQLRFARAGVADVVVADQQCVRLDLKEEVLRTGACFIATSEQACAGLPDETAVDPEVLACQLVERAEKATFVADPERAARLAVALALRGKRAHPSAPTPVAEDAAPCTKCGDCDAHCPLDLPVAQAVADLAWQGDWSALQALTAACLRCGRCDTACPVGIPVTALIEAAAAQPPLRSLIRAGRGPITDFEIKSTGPSIVLGDIPGIVAFLACPDYPDGRDAVAWMATALARRGYIVLTAGCAAMDLAISDFGLRISDLDGQSLRNPQSEIRNPYALFPGTFDQGGVVNTGSCVSAAHAIGAAIKIAAIFLHRPLAGNYAGIADYILNRVGVVGVLWGGVTPKALAASAGANRLGIPVLFGPQGKRFRRTLEGNPRADWTVYDARTGRRVRVGPAPAALCTTAATREEALVQIARLCLRPNDTTFGRQVKLHHYIELSQELLGRLPDDLTGWIRSHYDIPPAWEEAVRATLERDGWEPAPIPDPTLLKRQ